MFCDYGLFRVKSHKSMGKQELQGLLAVFIFFNGAGNVYFKLSVTVAHVNTIFTKQ